MRTLQELLDRRKVLAEMELTIAKRLGSQSTIAKDKNGVELNDANIRARVAVVAAQLIKDFPNANPVLVGLLDGALPFLNLLCEALNKANYPFRFTTMSACSYGRQTVAGKLTLGALPKIPLHNETVIVVDDVADTFATYRKIQALFLTQRPAVLKLAVLINKPKERGADSNPDYTCFEAASAEAFLIGYGMDWAGELRNIPSINSVDPASLPTKEEVKALEELAELDVLIQNAIEASAEKLTGPGENSLFAGNASTTGLTCSAPGVSVNAQVN